MKCITKPAFAEIQTRPGSLNLTNCTLPKSMHVVSHRIFFYTYHGKTYKKNLVIMNTNKYIKFNKKCYLPTLCE